MILNIVTLWDLFFLSFFRFVVFIIHVQVSFIKEELVLMGNASWNRDTLVTKRHIDFCAISLHEISKYLVPEKSQYL